MKLRIKLLITVLLCMITGISIAGAADSTIIHIENHFDKESQVKWPYASTWGATVSYEDGVLKCVSDATGSIWGQQLYIHNKDNVFPVEKDKDYIISMRAKAGENFKGMSIVQGSTVKSVGAITEEWSTVQFTFTSKANGGAYFVIGSTDNANLTATVYIDDFYLYEPAAVELVSSTPANGSKVMPTSRIELNFNNAMDRETLENPLNYEIDGGLGISEIQISEDLKQCVLIFDNEMSENSVYNLLVSNLKDSIGQELGMQIITFETGEYGLPVINETIPADGDTNVSLDVDMRVVFDSDMDVSTLIADNVSVNGSGDNIDAVLTNEENPEEILISFKNLEYMTCYTVKLSGMMNERGKCIEDTEISFVTCPESEILYENKISSSTDITYPNLSGGGNYITLKLDTENYYSAPASLKYTVTDSSQEIGLADNSLGYKLTVGEYYTISFRVKATENTSSSMYLVNGDNKSYLMTGISADDEWKEYSKTFKANTTQLPWFRIPGTSNEMLMDDIKITKLAKTELLPLSDFPKQCEIEVPVNSQFTMVFSNNISPDTVNIKLGGENVNIISAENNKIVFEPTTGLEYDKVYKIEASLQDAFGRDILIEREFRTTAVFATSGVKLYANGVNITNSNLAGGNIEAVIEDLTNNTDEATVACIVIALYKDGKMVNAKAKEIPLGAGSSILAPVRIGMDDTGNLTDGEYMLRAFLWKNYEEIIPLAGKTEIKE